MFWYGAAQVDDSAEMPRVALQEGHRVEPEARKNRRTVQPILMRSGMSRPPSSLEHFPTESRQFVIKSDAVSCLDHGPDPEREF
jgi:hypothetical protein